MSFLGQAASTICPGLLCRRSARECAEWAAERSSSARDQVNDGSIVAGSSGRALTFDRALDGDFVGDFASFMGGFAGGLVGDLFKSLLGERARRGGGLCQDGERATGRRLRMAMGWSPSRAGMVKSGSYVRAGLERKEYSLKARSGTVLRQWLDGSCRCHARAAVLRTSILAEALPLPKMPGAGLSLICAMRILQVAFEDVL
jgi:hypothetical protein